MSLQRTFTEPATSPESQQRQCRVDRVYDVNYKLLPFITAIEPEQYLMRSNRKLVVAHAEPIFGVRIYIYIYIYI